MELWIRSQDKLDLLKCKSIHIEEIPSSKEVAILCYASGDKHSTIGYYKSKERALEVIDDIQCFLNGSITKDLYVNGDYCGSWETQRNEIVYEMPKE